MVNPAQLVKNGITAIRTTFPAADIPGILLSYLDGIHMTFILGVALAGVSVIPALFAPWRNIDAAAALSGGA